MILLYLRMGSLRETLIDPPGSNPCPLHPNPIFFTPNIPHPPSDPLHSPTPTPRGVINTHRHEHLGILLDIRNQGSLHAWVALMHPSVRDNTSELLIWLTTEQLGPALVTQITQRASVQSQAFSHDIVHQRRKHRVVGLSDHVRPL